MNAVSQEMTAPSSQLIILGHKGHRNDINSVIERFVKEKNLACLYLSFNLPFMEIKSILSNLGVDAGRVVVIDCMTSSGSTPKNAENCISIGDPGNLTGAALAFVETLHQLENGKVIIVDSVDTMLTYNHPESVIKFLHMVTVKSKETGASLAILAGHSCDGSIIGHIEQFVDIVENQGDDKK